MFTLSNVRAICRALTLLLFVSILTPTVYHKIIYALIFCLYMTSCTREVRLEGLIRGDTFVVISSPNVSGESNKVSNVTIDNKGAVFFPGSRYAPGNILNVSVFQLLTKSVDDVCTGMYSPICTTGECYKVAVRCKAYSTKSFDFSSDDPVWGSILMAIQQ